MKKITYKQSEGRTIHETVDMFLEHLEKVREERKRIQTQCLFGSMLDELVLASIEDQRNWGPGIDLKKFGGSITLSPSSVRLGPITQPHVDALIEGTLPFVASAFTNTTRDEITFNGSPMKDVISYDEITGEVHYYEVDWHSNNYIPDSDDPTGYRTARSKGQVQVQTKYKAPAPPPAANTDLNKEPYNGCGIDPNYAPWYTQSVPSFHETVQKVEFEFCGFEPVFLDHRFLSRHKASCLDKLVIDGVDLGVGWTLVQTNPVNHALGLCFVKLDIDMSGNMFVAEHSELDSLQLRGKAHIAPGYTHIYKIVSVPSACFSLHTPNMLPPADVLDPKTWMPGSRVEIRNNPHYSAPDTGTITTMKRLC